MSIVAQCPSCQSQLQLPDDMHGKEVECRLCLHRFVIHVLHAATAPEIAPQSTVPDALAGSQTNPGSELSHSDVTLLAAHKPGPVLFGMPFSASVARLGAFTWLGALILFFLPWVDIRCTNAGGEVTSQHKRICDWNAKA
jgi:hypothetical protein